MSPLEIGPAEVRDEETEELAEMQLGSLEQTFLSCLVFPLDFQVGCFLRPLTFFILSGTRVGTSESIKWGTCLGVDAVKTELTSV